MPSTLASASVSGDGLEGLAAAVRSLVDVCVAGARARFSQGALAVAARSTVDSPGDLDRLVLGLARGRLGDLGIEALALPVSPGTSAMALDEAARAGGAEWLLSIRVDRSGSQGPPGAVLELRAEIRAIDAGLWAPPPAPDAVPIAALAARSVPIDDQLRVLLGAGRVDPAPGPGIVSTGPGLTRLRPERVAIVDDEVLALASCDLDGDRAPELVVLGRTRLTVLGTDAAAAAGAPVAAPLTERGRLRLGELPRAPVPVREAIGSVVCADLDGDGRPDLAFGHSSLDRGYRAAARITPPSVKGGAPGLELTLAGALKGVPLAALAGGALILGRPDEGRNRWSGRIELGAPGKELPVDLGAPLLELRTSTELPGPAGTIAGPRYVAVSVDHTLYTLGDDLGGRRAIGASGVGVSVFNWKGSTLIVTTSSSAAGGHDELRILRGDGTPLSPALGAPISGAVQAGAVLEAPSGIAIYLAVRRPLARLTEIDRLELPR